MRQLNQMVSMVVASVKSRQITIGMLNAYFLREGMEPEEVTLLLEIVALEVKLTTPPTFAMVRAAKAYKATKTTKLPYTIDMVG